MLHDGEHHSAAFVFDDLHVAGYRALVRMRAEIDRPLVQGLEPLRGMLVRCLDGLPLAWGAEESGAANLGFGGALLARPARAA